MEQPTGMHEQGSVLRVERAEARAESALACLRGALRLFAHEQAPGTYGEGWVRWACDVVGWDARRLGAQELPETSRYGRELREVVDTLEQCIDALEGRDGADVCTELGAAAHWLEAICESVADEEEEDEPISCRCGACSCMSREDLDGLGICGDCRRGAHEE